MRFTYCPHCGGKLTEKEIGDEGKIPYCDACRIPLWEIATTCVICAVVNEYREIALIRQSDTANPRYVCVAGYMKIGESAEDAAAREIREELGLCVDSLRYIRSYPYPEKELLMLGFKATVKKADFTLSGEVESAQWVPFENAPNRIRQGSIAWQLTQAVTKEDIDHA